MSSNSTWQFTVDLSDINLHGGRAPTVECSVVVEVFKTESRVTRAGDTRCIFYARVTQGPQEGCVITSGLNIPVDPTLANVEKTGRSMDELAKNARILKRFLGKMLLSCGFSEKSICKSNLTISHKTFLGRKGFVHFVPAPEGGRYSEVNWLPEEQFDKIEYEAEESTPQGAPNVWSPPAVPSEVAVAVEPAVVDVAPSEEPPPLSATSDSEDPLSFLTL